MKPLPIFLGLALAMPALSPGEVVLGGADTPNVDNWTTNSVPFSQGTSDGYSLDWENVLTNNAIVDSANNEFDLEWETGVDHTIGHLFMFNTTVDLADLAAEGGVQSLDWTANFEATDFNNWSPVISVTDGGITTYYRWNHSGNTWSGNDDLDFSLGIFDLSQLGNGIGAGAGNTGIWGELRAIPDATITNFGQTRTNNIGPNLQAPTGVLQFGFLQWGSSGGGEILAGTTFSTAIDSFEIVINSDDPIFPPTVVTLPTTGDRATSAVLRGEITNDGGEFPNVTLYFGTTDGADFVGDWENFVELGPQGGAFETTVSGLLPETTYFFRAYATNSAGDNWGDTQMVTTLAITGIGEPLGSDQFAFQYEMDVVPSTQDLDMAGSATDWFAATAGGVTIPMVAGGIASSDALSAPPGVLFRTDFGGSIQRESLGGDFTIEVALRIIGPIEDGDAGIFGFALDPGGAASSFRLNIDTESVSLDGDRNSEIVTGSNTDAFHVYRIAWNSTSDEWTAWRDGVMVYNALAGTNAPFNNNGSFFIGDFSGSLSGEWEVDYIRLHNAAASPPATGGLEILGVQIADGNVEIIWRGVPSTDYALSRSTDLVTWDEFNDELSGGTGEVQTTVAEPVVDGGSVHFRISEF